MVVDGSTSVYTYSKKKIHSDLIYRFALSSLLGELLDTQTPIRVQVIVLLVG